MPDIRAVAGAICQDVRYGARVLTRAPAMTAVIVLALALGIGANSAMFSVVDAILMHPLSYEKPQDLSIVLDRDAQGQLRGTSAANFLEWRKARSFSGLASWAPSVNILDGEQPVQVFGARVTANMFQVLGVEPFMGRAFKDGEDGLDGSATVSKVVVISYGLWRDALGSDPNVLGRALRLSGVPFTVIGVMPQGFELVNRRHQLWVPAVLNATNRDYRYLMVIGRRRASSAEAVSEMQSISQSLAEAFPGSNRGWSAYVENMQDWLVDQRTRSRLLLLFAALGLVLLLACSNVAGLLLARSVSRSREIALRTSLGATRGRIVAELLAESLLLSLMGGAAGVVLAWSLVQIAPSYVPAGALGTSAPFELSVRVLGFTLAVSVLTGILFGLAPALAASRPDVQQALQDGTRGSTGGRARQMFRQAMVAAEVAVALALLSGAVLTVRSLQRLASVDVGLTTANVLAQRIFLPATTYDAARSLSFNRQVLARVAASPGVTQAAMGSALPLARPGMEVSFDLESDPVRPPADMRAVTYITVSPGYFNVLKVPLLTGREFEDTDSEDGPRVAIVNQSFARRYFPNGDIVGQRVRLNRPILGTNDFGPIEYARIVGVAGNVTLDEIGAPAPPLLYAPMAQNVWTTAHWLAVRTPADPTSAAANVRRIIRELDPSQPLDPGTTLDERFSAQFAAPRFQSGLMGLFAILALLLAVVGIYSINAYAVTQRTREIGVRLALGASPGSVMRNIFQQGMKLTLAGVVVGLAGAAALNSVLGSILVDVRGIEITPMLGAALILTVAAAGACMLPAWRATRIDPAITLRKE
jgi:putative ABC transport system permease protein